MREKTLKVTTKPLNQETNQPLPLSGLLNLLVVYIVWGSTYLAIRVAVREGAGFPPFSMGLMRVTVAGGMLLLWAWLARKRIRLARRELLVLAASGLLLWTGGNGLVMVAEQRADSGLAALMVATAPIWVAVIEALIDRRSPSWLLLVSLLVGFGGIGVLSVPVLREGVRADLLSLLALVLASFSWSLGSVLQSRNPVTLSPQASAGVQMLAGGAGFAILALLVKEPRPTPTPEAWLAWGYLVVIGGVLAFTSFVVALRLLPTSVVMTYAYVNPVIAVALGWLLLNEQVTVWTIGGSALVLLGVAGVFRNRSQQQGR